MARTTTAVVALLVMLMGACDREEAIPPLEEDDGAAETPPGAPPASSTSTAFTLKSYATSSRAKHPKSHGWRGRPARRARLCGREGDSVETEVFRAPVLEIGSTYGGTTRKLGPGRSPVWSPDGSLIAAVSFRPDSYLFCARRRAG
jgi:hypothetical protein